MKTFTVMGLTADLRGSASEEEAVDGGPSSSSPCIWGGQLKPCLRGAGEHSPDAVDHTEGEAPALVSDTSTELPLHSCSNLGILGRLRGQRKDTEGHWSSCPL